MSFIDVNVERYVDKKNDVLPERLAALRRQAIGAHVPIISDQVSAFLAAQLALIKPRRILEIGTAIGYSGALLLHYSTAHLTTIESDAAVRQRALDNFDALGLTARVTALLGDASAVLTTLTEQYDFVFIDAGKAHYLDYFKKAERLVAPNGVIVADNVLLRGYLAGEPHPRRQRTANGRMENFINYARHQRDFQTALLTIGDGILISVKGNQHE